MANKLKLNQIFINDKVTFSNEPDAVVYNVEEINDTIVTVSISNKSNLKSFYSNHYSLLQKASYAQLNRREEFA